MEFSIKTLGFVLVVCSFFYQVNCEVNFCYQQKCRECSQKDVDVPSVETKCEIRSLVSTTWLDEADKPSLAGPEVEVDYVCLKLSAYSSTINGDSMDVIKGCALKATAERLCDALSGIENARDKTYTKCSICTKDFCNGAFGLKTSLSLLIITALVSMFVSM